MFGSRGSDDLYGGPGDDIINGRAGNDEIWGGEGDDILRAAGTARPQEESEFIDVVHGGPGNDLIYGGTDTSLTGAVNGRDDFKYLYGDEGDDRIFGSNNAANQFIWGGSGDDVI